MLLWTLLEFDLCECGGARWLLLEPVLCYLPLAYGPPRPLLDCSRTFLLELASSASLLYLIPRKLA